MEENWIDRFDGLSGLPADVRADLVAGSHQVSDTLIDGLAPWSVAGGVDLAAGSALTLVRSRFTGMSAAEGILTAKGGMTSHAAVVARGMGKSCVVVSPSVCNTICIIR